VKKKIRKKNTYILERNTQPILDGVDHPCWTSLILPTGSERGEEQGIRGELKCVHFCLIIIWPLDRKKRIKTVEALKSSSAPNRKERTFNLFFFLFAIIFDSLSLGRGMTEVH
jgi:hypothetical protein